MVESDLSCSKAERFICPYNLRLTKKLLWMAGRLGSFNDPVAISSWATSMTLIKNLLWKTPQDQFLEPSVKVKNSVFLTRSKPCCTSTYSPQPKPAMSIMSAASSNLLPSPSQISPGKEDLAHNPAISTDVSTSLFDKEPMSQPQTRCQQTTLPTCLQRWGNNLRNNYQYPTDRKCSVCDNNLAVVCTNENVICHQCCLCTKDSQGNAQFWECSSCEYLSCFYCIKKWHKKRKKRR